MPSYLFVGIESYTWKLPDFQPVLDLLVSSGIDGAIVKVYEIENGQWISDADWQTLYATFSVQGKSLLPYGYFYGGTGIITEANMALHWLNTFGSFIIDAEVEFNGQSAVSQQLASVLSNHKGTLYITTWANPVSQNWMQNIQNLNSVVQYWMPQIYSDNLGLLFEEQFPKVNGVVIPVLSIAGDGDPNHPDTIITQDGHFKDVALWEYQTALSNTSVVSSLLSAMQGESNVILNSDDTVLTLLSGSQFEPNETEFACGYFASSVLKYAQPPKQVNSGSWESVDVFADDEYIKVYGSDGPTQTGGISVDELHTVFLHAGNLHYWDIAAISSGSAQSSDIANIKAALNAGYPVVATIVEQSVNDLTGDIPTGNPYEWNPGCNSTSCPTHVLIWIGIASDGNLLAWDYANVVGPLQGSNTVRKQPRKYDIASINNTFATVVQVVGPDAANPWLKPIPSGDPTTWPSGFNAQNFTSQVDLKQKAFNQEWPSVLSNVSLTSGIAKQAYADYWTPNFPGPALSEEFQLTMQDGSEATAQVVVNGIYVWQNGVATLHKYS